MSRHIHKWQYVKQFVADGEPKVMQRLTGFVSDNGAPEVATFMDSSHKYAQFICECGKIKNESVQL